MNIHAVAMASAFPSLGDLIGTSGSEALINNINASMNSATFLQPMNETCSQLRNIFLENVVNPIKRTGHLLTSAVNTIVNPDRIRPLVEEDHLRSIPPSMHLPILLHAPVRKLFDQGRIAGFGYTEETIPSEDVYGRLINNGLVENVVAAMDEEGGVEFVFDYKSTDPDLSDDEMDAIQETREFIDGIIRDTIYDPTSYPDERG